MGAFKYQTFKPDLFFRHLIVTNEAMVEMISETLCHPKDETGVVLAGYFCSKGTIVVTDVVDPGFSRNNDNIAHTSTFFSYDSDYVNHRLQEIRKLRLHRISFLGVVHRHPGNYDEFSSTDELSILGDLRRHSYSVETPDGVIATGLLYALINIDPILRISWFYITPDGVCQRLDNTKDVSYVDAESLPSWMFERVGMDTIQKRHNFSRKIDLQLNHSYRHPELISTPQENPVQVMVPTACIPPKMKCVTIPFWLPLRFGKYVYHWYHQYNNTTKKGSNTNDENKSCTPP